MSKKEEAQAVVSEEQKLEMAQELLQQKRERDAELFRQEYLALCDKYRYEISARGRSVEISLGVYAQAFDLSIVEKQVQ